MQIFGLLKPFNSQFVFKKANIIEKAIIKSHLIIQPEIGKGGATEKGIILLEVITVL